VHSPSVQPKLPPRREPLLQKLLAREIRQEHSHLLQCFRFLVNNNFLQDLAAGKLVYPVADGSPADFQAGEPSCRGCRQQRSKGRGGEESEMRKIKL